MSLYLVTSAATLAIKVGYTGNLDSRAKSYATTNPEFSGFDDSCEGSKQDEKRIHAYFDSCNNLRRVGNTEWYRCENKAAFKFIKTNGLSGIKKRTSQFENELFDSLEDPTLEKTSRDSFDKEFCAGMARKVSSENSYVNKRIREIKNMIMEKASTGGNHVTTSISYAQGQPVVAWLRSKGFEVYGDSSKACLWEECKGYAFIYW